MIKRSTCGQARFASLVTSSPHFVEPPWQSVDKASSPCSSGWRHSVELEPLEYLHPYFSSSSFEGTWPISLGSGFDDGHRRSFSVAPGPPGQNFKFVSQSTDFGSCYFGCNLEVVISSAKIANRQQRVFFFADHHLPPRLLWD